MQARALTSLNKGNVCKVFCNCLGKWLEWSNGRTVHALSQLEIFTKIRPPCFLRSPMTCWFVQHPTAVHWKHDMFRCIFGGVGTKSYLYIYISIAACTFKKELLTNKQTATLLFWQHFLGGCRFLCCIYASCSRETHSWAFFSLQLHHKVARGKHQRAEGKEQYLAEGSANRFAGWCPNANS